MGILVHSPNGDYRNDGWGLIGNGIAAIWQALSNFADDARYIRSPSSKSSAGVTFPTDISSVPAGAVITSVTLMIRCATGNGSAPAGVAPSVSLVVAAQDDPSKFLTRTIAPTSTPTSYEIATYRADALGFAWDIFRLNFLFCRIFCYLAIFDLIRVHALWGQVNYRVRPVITVDAPFGTVLTPSPIVSWTYKQDDGDPQAGSVYKVFTSTQVAAVGFNPESSSPVYRGETKGEVSQVLLPTSLNPDSYWVFVQSRSSFNAKSTWTGRQFSVSGPAPGTPGVADPTGQLAPGTNVIGVVPDASSGATFLTLRDTSNMLGANTADAETTEGSLFTSIGCTTSRSTSFAYPGGNASWRLQSTSSGNSSTFTDWVEVQPGLAITGRAQFLANAAARSVSVQIGYYDYQFGLIGSNEGPVISDTTGTWTEAVVTGTVPANSVYARLILVVFNSSNNEVHYVDHLGLMYGTNTSWSDGGHMSRNLLTAYASTGNGSPVDGDTWYGGTGTSAFTTATTGTGATGANSHVMVYAGVNPSIAYRAAGSVFTSPTSGRDYTLTAPAGVAAGDLMLAFVTSSEFSTITPPDGWTLSATSRVDDGATDVALFVLKRTAGESEPSTWTDGRVSVTSARRTAAVVAYSGAADASQQFLAETQVTTGNPTPLWLTTPALNNTDSNAWRVAAFVLSDDQPGGTLTANRQAPSTIPPITYVGTASPWTTQSGYNNANWVINRPSGVAAGDLMLATVTISGNTTINASNGWTLLYREKNGTGGEGLSYAVMYRICGPIASEPASYPGTVTAGSAGQFKLVTAEAYRNVNTSDPFISSIGTPVGTGRNATTLTATNTNSLGWRVSTFAANMPGYVLEFSGSDSSRRNSYYGYAGGGISSAMFDSNGAVGAGPHSRTGYASNSFFSAFAYIAILNPVAIPPSAVADETARVATAIGSGNPYMSSRVFDSSGVIPTGSQSITGIWNPGSGSDKNAMTGWAGIIKPAAPVTAGYVSAYMTTPIDVSSIDRSQIPDMSRVTVLASFIGNTAGTPYLSVYFLRANQVISQSIAQGSSFKPDLVWTKSAATFDVPEGTTRMQVAVSVADRNVNDTVLFTRVSLAYGEDATYRETTSRGTHPVWAKPQIQYADDEGAGYGAYTDLPGTLSKPPSFVPLSGRALYTDHTPIPLTNRKYRARTVSTGLNGDQFISDWGPASSETSFVAESWWLKSIANPDRNIELSVKWEAQKIGTTNTATVFQPLGEQYPVVLTEGYKADTFSLTLTPVSHNGWVNLRKMLESGETLFLQSDVDLAWWVRPVGDLQSAILETGKRRENPLREITVQFVEVSPEL